MSYKLSQTIPDRRTVLVLFSLVLVALLLTSSVLMAAPMQSRSASKSKTKPLPSSVTTLEQLPSGALEINEAMKIAKQGQVVTLRGRIPSAKDAFVANRAMFTLVDDVTAATCCPADGSIADTCSAPAESKATIVIADAQDTPLATELQGKGGLTHGAEVFVVGKVQSANGGNDLIVHATGIHVPPNSLPVGFFLREMPQDARNLTEIKSGGELKKGDRIIAQGVIGGSVDPFVPGRAVFTLMGNGLKPCNANPDDHCKTPWDYCCETRGDITSHSATIRAADSKGNPFRTDFKGRMGMKEQSNVIVIGKVAMNQNGAVIVDAENMYVPPRAD